MRRRSFLACAAGLVAKTPEREDRDPVGALWPRPVILPIPESTSGVKTNVLSLAGTWKISVDAALWRDVIVPGQADKQGVPIKREQAYAYRKDFSLPADFGAGLVFLRFEGVTGRARASINGHPIEEHQGGFTIWNRNVTAHVRPGGQNSLFVEVIDSRPQNATSGFDYGGILRDVKVMAVPADYLTRLHVETAFDSDFRNATMKVSSAVAFTQSERCRVDLEIIDPQGRRVPIKPHSVELDVRHTAAIVEIPVAAAMKWDAEHPNLYVLEAHLITNEKHLGSVRRVVGFRQIEVQGRTLLVNGKAVKLRGGGRFDSNPWLGHTLSPEQCEQEVRMLKEANVNYIRPACFPAMEEYLLACDRLGMYVEGETNVTFTRGTESDPQFTPLFMNQMAEMIEANRSHPSILFWSLGNESNYGINIRRMYAYTKAEDPTRLILFSWSQSIPPTDPLPYNLYSYHYPSLDVDMGVPGVAVFNAEATHKLPATMPVLHDEFAHGACYDRDELQRDPNVRNFWGESIKTFWEKMYRAEGCLGGAIWALIDETGSGPRGYPWGMTDLWRREKPEYWLMKKAYSPIRIADEPVENPGSGRPLRISVRNWFNHTNLAEVRIEWIVGGDSGTMQGPDVPPGRAGEIEIPARNWRDGDVLRLVCRQAGLVLDEYKLPIGRVRHIRPMPLGTAPGITDSGNMMTIRGTDFQILLDKKTGLITNGAYGGTNLIESGPHFHLIGADLAPWEMRTIQAIREGVHVVVRIHGSHGPVEVSYTIRVDGDGLLTTEYTLDQFSLPIPTTKLVPWNRTDAGGLSEVGISFVLSSEVDALAWSRKGLWSVYPDTHIGRTSGTARREGSGRDANPDAEPRWPWLLDEKDTMLFGPNDQGGRGTNDFRSMKEYVYSASAIASRNGARLRAESDGNHAVRLEVVGAKPGGPVRMMINNEWNYTHLGLGNYMKPPVIVKAGYSNAVRVRITNSDEG